MATAVPHTEKTNSLTIGSVKTIGSESSGHRTRIRLGLHENLTDRNKGIVSYGSLIKESSV